MGEPRLPAPNEAQLTDFPREVATPLFRLKVIDPGDKRGRLLADARQIRPVNAGDKKETRQGLLYIGHQDLDGLVWDLEIDRAGFEPTLWIDSEADPTRELARDPKFIALVYPEVFRGVLTSLILDENSNTIDDETEWGHAWYQMALGLPDMAGESPPHADDDRDVLRQWIGQAARAFARNARACELIAPAEEIPA